MENLALCDNWQFKVRDPASSLEQDFIAEDGWLPATVPGSVHQDLLATGRIPDPFYGLNEKEVQWVGESDWLYRCTFDLPANFEQTGKTELCFDGLDTFATVWLNGQQILISDNMFVPQRVEVSSLLRPGSNELQILFESAFRRGEQLETRYGRLVAWNGAPSRLYVRKAQYHYGWDWGPVLITVGLWQPVRLETFAGRIADLHCPVEVSPDLSSATINLSLQIETAGSIAPGDLAVELNLVAPDGTLVAAQQVAVQAGSASHTFELDKPELWWPNGYGKQPLYRLSATLKNGSQALDHAEKRLGLRRLRLVQELLQNELGSTFFFEVNNRPLFCSGANWIPADSFTPRVDVERYRQHLQLAADANMLMIRVWGGGIYEEDHFYDICDELGLLVWQDFMFACGLYPAYDWFQQSVKAEAEAAIRRLRHHPCLALWCGNNEDYAIAESQGLYDPSFEGDFTQTAFPARAIYEHLLPEVCARLDPTRTYWPGSPYGGKTSGEPTIGDRHTWDVWHGGMADYHDYPKYAGRFVSEFGMEALPALTTVQSFAPESEQYPYSRVIEFHNRSDGGNRRLAAYQSDNLPMVITLEDYLYATQFVQSEALAFALRGWRRRWGGPGNYAVSGAVVWQLNDCWPVTSWAIVDYYLNPKPAYYALRREMAPVTVNLWNSGNGKAALWGVNNHTATIEAEVYLTTWTLNGEKVSEERRPVVLKPEQATEWGELPYNPEAEQVLSATLQKDGAVLARATLWPEPFKYLKLSDPEIQVLRLPGDRLQVQASRPAKGVFLTTDARVEWSDNMLDLIPREPQVISAAGLGTAELKIQGLYSLYPSNKAVTLY
ncbi:MAG TPA: glycoside hydrolase family 2 protein [Chloroflexia bacterium]|nr:glycoside hydrolase family 2 protein [Chloroflexia bacterium]